MICELLFSTLDDSWLKIIKLMVILVFKKKEVLKKKTFFMYLQVTLCTFYI